MSSSGVVTMHDSAFWQPNLGATACLTWAMPLSSRIMVEAPQEDWQLGPHHEVQVAHFVVVGGPGVHHMRHCAGVIVTCGLQHVTCGAEGTPQAEGGRPARPAEVWTPPR